jgi:hypothetical protein
MSESESEPDPETVEQVKELHQKKDEVVGEAKAQHDALLEAAAEGEEAVLEEFETVYIGNAQITAHTQIPGEVMRKLDDIYENELPPGKMLDVYIDVLTAQTKKIQTEYEGETITVEGTGSVRQFYRNWIDRHDAESAAMLALERVVEKPNNLEEKRREDAMKSFPSDKSSPRNRGPREWRS